MKNKREIVIDITRPTLSIEANTLKFNPHDLVYIIRDDVIIITDTVDQIINTINELGLNSNEQEQVLQTLESRVKELEDNVEAIQNVDITQNARLAAIEAAQITSTYDYGIVETTGIANTTSQYLPMTIDRDFNTEDLVNINNEGDYTIFEVLKKGTAEFQFYINAKYVETTNLVITVEAIDLADETVLDSAALTVNLPESGEEVFLGTRTLVFDNEDLSKDVAIRINTSVGSVEGTIAALFKLTVDSGVDVVTDQLVVSTQEKGNTTTAGDITALFDKDTSLEQTISDMQQTITKLQEDIESITSDDTSLIPVGGFYMSANDTPPSYGNWSRIGQLSEGQTIIGGETSDGELKSHNHQWLANSGKSTVAGAGGNNSWVPSRMYTYDTDGAQTITMGGGSNNDSAEWKYNAYTTKVGGDYNKAWGLGLGTVFIYRRTS